jgi:fructokinase
VFGAIEAGGTKFVCGVGTGPEDLTTVQIPTTSPQATIESAIAFVRQHSQGQLQSVGIGSFGPIDLHAASPTFGFISSTPKAGWQNCNLVGAFRKALDVPVGFDTDVSAAALGEQRWGAGQGLSDFLYMTVGTGVGGGAIVNGNVLHGLVHPEMGHIRVPHDWTADPFPGVCPLHGDCLEGLASGPAIQARWGSPARELPLGHPGLALEARYLAFALANFTFALSPQRILLGGGVMQETSLFALIRRELTALLGGYLPAPELQGDLATYVMPPKLRDRAGILGALVLADRAFAGHA